MSKGGKGGSGAAAQQQQLQEALRQGQIAAGTGAINSTFDKQFDPAFFDRIKQSYLDYENPQLDKQYGDAQKQLTYSLARSGNLDSSTRADQTADLAGAYRANQQTLANNAQTAAQTARSNVESSRQSLIQALNSTGDATGAANAAATAAQGLSTPMSYSPLGDMFGGFSSALAQQGSLEKLSAMTNGIYKPTYNTGLFGVPSNAVVNK